MNDGKSQTTDDPCVSCDCRHIRHCKKSTQEDALRVEIVRLRVEISELRASRDAWSNRAMAVQRDFTERLCK